MGFMPTKKQIIAAASATMIVMTAVPAQAQSLGAMFRNAWEDAVNDTIRKHHPRHRQAGPGTQQREVCGGFARRNDMANCLADQISEESAEREGMNRYKKGPAQSDLMNQLNEGANTLTRKRAPKRGSIKPSQQFAAAEAR